MLPVAASYVIAVLLLACGFYFAKPLATLRRVGHAARVALNAMQDASLDELEKEKTVQRCAMDMTRQAVTLTVKLAVILAVAALPVWLAITLAWMGAGQFWDFVLRVDVLLLTTAALLAPFITRRIFSKPGQ